MKRLKQFFKLYSITLLFSFLSLEAGATNQGATNQVSVHEMFKDVPQEELLAMMEEGQQFIKYLEEHGTAEEKMAFAQAMEETLKGFTEEDWAEFEAIVETVQDKLPPLEIEPKKEEPVIKEEPKKEESKVVSIDNTVEKLLHSIHKAINAILLKAKSDKILTERIAITWDKKDEFNELHRLLQTLNKKDHIIKLTSSKDEEVKTLLESIQNFNKRLQSENENFIIADTFGLEADEETTAINLKKLNKILEFFDQAVESLLPKLIKFFEAFEPEALKKAKEQEESAKKALEHATKIEKQKRPIGNAGYADRSPSNGSKNNYDHYGYNQNQGNGYVGSQGSSHDYSPSYLESVHQENLKNIPQLKKTSEKGSTPSEEKTNAEAKKNAKKSAYATVIDTLETYLDMFGNQDVGNYMATVGKAGTVYKPFGTPISESDRTRAENIIERRSLSNDLKSEEAIFLQKYEDALKVADKNFAKNTRAAYTHYGELKDAFDNLSPQIDEMQKVLQSIKVNLDQMSSKDLEKLNSSISLKTLNQRIHTYHNTLKTIQSELKNKHRLHQLKRQDPFEERDYNELANKVHSLHGLDKKISDVKSQLEILHKAIKSAIARRKREENKAATAQ
ncbi:MAG: hypothetical protein JO129_00345 [Candidatus Dependentiae bacterium]|nr:hypothetical protein [Candidatus Dependentiae bacterium]